MKIINFINPINPNDERSCIIWFRLTLTLWIITIAFISYMQVSQLIIWSSYRREYKKYSSATKQYSQITEEKKKLSDQEQSLKNRLSTITNTHDQCCKRIAQLNSLRTLCTNDMQLVACSLTSAGMEITLNCSTIEHAQACCTALNKNKQCIDLNIASITPKKHSINVTLKTTQK